MRLQCWSGVSAQSVQGMIRASSRLRCGVTCPCVHFRYHEARHVVWRASGTIDRTRSYNKVYRRVRVYLTRVSSVGSRGTKRRGRRQVWCGPTRGCGCERTSTSAGLIRKNENQAKFENGELHKIPIGRVSWIDVVDAIALHKSSRGGYRPEQTDGTDSGRNRHLSLSLSLPLRVASSPL